MAGEAVAIALAVVALVVSVLAYRLAAGGPAAHPRAQPAGLRLRVTKGQAARNLADDTREYLLLVELANDSGAAVTISSCQLRVTYRTRANFLGAVDLELASGLVLPGSRPSLELPLVVLPRSTVTGPVRFTTSNVIPRHSRVQDYTLVVAAEGGERAVADASLPALLAADTDGQGPATWGWD